MRTVYYNGNVITLEAENCTGFLVEKGKFAAVGDGERLAEEYADAKKIDLEGKTVLPGFFETHMHVLSLGMFLRNVNHSDCRSIEELIRHSKNYIRQNKIPAGKWVRGRGWNQDKFEDERRFINRYDLDKISTEHPLAFVRACGHVIVTNSKGLELLGMAESAPQIEGGLIDTDEKGVPLGIFREKAREYIFNAIPEYEVEEIKEMILLAQEQAVANGIVEIHTDDFKDVPNHWKRVIQAYEELMEEGKMKVRIYEQCNLPSVSKIRDFLACGYHTGWKKGDYLTLGPYKFLSDGALGARTAALREPYDDDSGNRGILFFSQEEADKMIEEAQKAGMQIAIHAIGDRAVDLVMDAIEKARRKYPRKEDERHGIIHCQVTDKGQMERMKKMNLIAYIQPVFLNYDLHIAYERLGIERAENAYNWKSFLDMGIHTVGSSDCPVESLNIMENIYSAMVRKDLQGYPDGGWKPEQNLSLTESLKLFSKDGAYASFSEETAGSVKVGKYADFVVIDRDITKTPADEIKNIRVEKTFLYGKKVYDINI